MDESVLGVVLGLIVAVFGSGAFLWFRGSASKKREAAATAALDAEAKQHAAAVSKEAETVDGAQDKLEKARAEVAKVISLEEEDERSAAMSDLLNHR